MVSSACQPMLYTDNGATPVMIRPTRTAALLAATAAAALTFIPAAAGAQESPTDCIIVTFTVPAQGPQILRHRTVTSVPCDAGGYPALEGARDAAAAETCLVSQVDLVYRVAPWTTSAIGQPFPEDVPGALSNFTDIVSTRTDCDVPAPAPVVPPVADAPVIDTPVAPAPPQAEAPPAVLASLPVAAASSVAQLTAPSTPATPAAQLPVTGASSTPWLAALSAALLAVGAGLVSQTRRLARR